MATPAPGTIAANPEPREFAFTDQDFETLRRMVMEHAGIALSDAKRQLIYSRLSRRLRALSLRSFSDYVRLLDGDNEELVNFVNAVTTNLTSFFRENHHFEYLAGELMSYWTRSRAGKRSIRIWSAGCSTGEEPYSIAMTMLERLPGGWDFKLLATDLDTQVLATASAGIYAEERVNGIAPARLRRWFRQGKGANAGKVRVSPDLQSVITFKQLNLMNDWPMRQPFDAIFCRNVIIYFDAPTKHRLAGRFAEQLTNDGHLFIGHSESLMRVSDRFELIGNTIYRRSAS